MSDSSRNCERVICDLGGERTFAAICTIVGIEGNNPNGAAALRRAGKGGVALREEVCANADEFARSLVPVIEEIRAGGQTSLRGIAAELNDRGIQTRRGGKWHVSNVRNLLARLD